MCVCVCVCVCVSRVSARAGASNNQVAGLLDSATDLLSRAGADATALRWISSSTSEILIDWLITIPTPGHTESQSSAPLAVEHQGRT